MDRAFPIRHKAAQRDAASKTPRQKYPSTFGKKEHSLCGLTSLCSDHKSGRDNLPLYVFCLQQMSSLVRHHPRQRGVKAHSKNSLADFDLCQIKPFLFTHQPFPFILRFHKSREYLQGIVDCCWRPNFLWCAKPEFGRRLGNPHQQASVGAEGKWAVAKLFLLLCLLDSARHNLLHRSRSRLRCARHSAMDHLPGSGRRIN